MRRRREGVLRPRRPRVVGRGDRQRAVAHPHAVTRRSATTRSPPSAGSSTSSRRTRSGTRPRSPRWPRPPAAELGLPDRGAAARSTAAGLVAGFGRLGRVERDLGQGRAALGRRVGAGAPPPAATPSACSTGRPRSPRPAGSPARSVSASTARATRAGLDGSAISRPSRILATADAFQSMREPRPHRPALVRRPRPTAGAARRRAGRPARRRRWSTRSSRAAGERVEPPARGPGRPHRPGGRGAAVPGPRACRTRRSPSAS